MLKIENYEVLGWEHAIRGMRNPMNSWEQSDSKPCPILNEIDVVNETWFCSHCQRHASKDCWSVGPNDLDLMKRLRKAGTDHRKFMRMLTVYVDITAPFYWWKEFDTYKVGTVANSCSTMHKVHAKEFTLEDFSHEWLTPISLRELERTIDLLNTYRNLYVNWDTIDDNTKNALLVHDKKECWMQMIQLLGSNYNQKRTVMLNYEVLANIYKSRRHHKLDEWHVLCDWIEKLPYAGLITGEEDATEANV